MNLQYNVVRKPLLISKCSLPESVSDTDPNEQASDNEASDTDENEDSTDQIKHTSCSKQNQEPQKVLYGKRSQMQQVLIDRKKNVLDVFLSETNIVTQLVF